MRLLAVDGDELCLKTFEMMLGFRGFNVYGIDSGEEAIDLGKLYDYDAIVLSETPDAQVDAVVRSIRAGKVTTPILVVSGDANVSTMVRTLDAGADDYMTKPFHADELVARINSLVRRSKGHATSILQVGPLAVNLSTKTATVHGQAVRFTGKEFSMLELLALRKGMTITKEMFLNHLYGGMDEPELKIIDVFICKLRRKLAAAGADGMVMTIWGRGYLLGEPVQVAA